MSRPLLISDCDEVLLHMIVPFRDWLDEAHHIHFDLVHGDWGEALRHKHDGTVVERGIVWELLNGFFDTEMHRQQAIDGAVESINALREVADVVILTNLLDHRAGPAWRAVEGRSASMRRSIATRAARARRWRVSWMNIGPA